MVLLQEGNTNMVVQENIKKESITVLFFTNFLNSSEQLTSNSLSPVTFIDYKVGPKQGARQPGDITESKDSSPSDATLIVNGYKHSWLIDELVQKVTIVWAEFINVEAISRFSTLFHHSLHLKNILLICSSDVQLLIVLCCEVSWLDSTHGWFQCGFARFRVAYCSLDDFPVPLNELLNER